MITKEQSIEIKKKLLSQLEKSNTENKQELKEYIEKLNEEELEEFLKQQNLQIAENKLQSEKCIFCSIIDNEIPSYKIDENKNAIAILEINPLSKGHSIVLPKEHVPIEKIKNSVLSLAKKISKRIKTKLKPKDVKIETSNLQNHAMINIIPIYNEPLEKKSISKEELESLKNKLIIKKRIKPIKKPKKLPEIPFRIP